MRYAKPVSTMPEPAPVVSPGEVQSKHKGEIKNVSLTHVIKNSQVGKICNISLELPKDVDYVAVNIHQTRACFATIHPLKTLGFRRSHDLCSEKKKLDRCSAACSLFDNS